MIALSRISLINWHLLAKADLDVFGNAAILGQNRSGKSTLIDLVQAVIAGGSARYFRFNRSAGETGSRSDRTLAGYCLGQLNEDSFLRDQALTHVALVFTDDAGARPPTTLGLSVEAQRGRSAEVVGRFVAEGVALDTSFFVDEDADGVQPALWPIVKRRLEQACAKAGGRLHTPGDARSFIREYMRVLFTRRRTSDPERFVRTFIAALSFTDMPSVEAFVRRYLLEQRDISVRELRESIQRYREIQRTIRDLERRLEALLAIRAQVSRYMALLEAEDVARSLERLALLIEAGAALVEASRSLKEALARQTSQRNELGAVEAEVTRQEELLAGLDRQLMASGAAAQRVVVDSEIRELDQAHARVQARVQARQLAAARATTLLDLRDRLNVINPGELIRALEAIRDASVGLAPADWPREPRVMDRLLDEAARHAATRHPKALERRNDAIGREKGMEEELREARERLAAASAGRVRLSTGTMALMDALRREGMRPRTLAEAAEVADERWRGAVEAIMVRDRETVIVDPEHASEATATLKSGGRRAFPAARVANTRRLQGQSRSPRDGTLASVLRSPDELVMAFAVHRVGNVRLAETQDDLLAGGRAVMTDGAYNDGLVTDIRQAPEYKIGRAAAPLMQGTLSARIDELVAIVATHRQTARIFDDIARRLEDCAEPVEPGERLDALTIELDDLAQRRTDARDRLGRIAATMDPALLDAHARAKAALADLGLDRDRLLKREGGIDADVKAARARVVAGENVPGSLLCLAVRRRTFKASVAFAAVLHELAPAYRRERGRPPARIAADMAKRASQAMEEHRELLHEIRAALGTYSLAFPDALADYGQAHVPTTVKEWVDQGVAALEGNELIQYRRQADNAADTVSRLFRTTFIHELNNRFGALHEEMQSLSKALRSRPLHGERYHLKETVKPEFADLHRLAIDSEHDESALDALFGRGEAKNEQHARALRQVEQLLGDEDHDFTVFEDYRNYFTFDLRTEDIATGRVTSFDRRRGVASGAERQVPFYVVIGAALASVYHGTQRAAGEEELGMGLAVFDEAFSKMDGPNQRTLLDFYRAVGLQVVIAAPSEKRAVVYENLDCIVDVFRIGDAAMAQSVRLKARTREELRRANPHHLSDDELADRLDAAGTAEAAE